MVELKDDIALTLQMCDQLTYDNSFVYFQPGNGKIYIKEPQELARRSMVLIQQPSMRQTSSLVLVNQPTRVRQKDWSEEVLQSRVLDHRLLALSKIRYLAHYSRIKNGAVRLIMVSSVAKASL